MYENILDAVTVFLKKYTKKGCIYRNSQPWYMYMTACKAELLIRAVRSVAAQYTVPENTTEAAIVSCKRKLSADPAMGTAALFATEAPEPG